MIYAHTDMSLNRRRKVSTHTYILRTYKGRKLKEVTYISNETDTVQAEMDSIVKLLNWCNGKKMSGIRIYTDNSSIVNAVNGIYNHKFDVSYLKHMLRITDSKLKWKSRRKNSEADRLCKQKMGVVINRLNNKQKVI